MKHTFIGHAGHVSYLEDKPVASVDGHLNAIKTTLNRVWAI
jgi:hypothetical protein